MEKKINIAELLKDCPIGTKLYSPLCGECKLDTVTCKSILVESITFKTLHFNEDGTYYDGYDDGYDDAECLLFPSKDQRDWSTFQRPFKDGDIIIKWNHIAIVSHIEPSGRIWYHCWYDKKYKDCKFKNDFGIGGIYDGGEIRLATEEEKQKLFKVIKENGYKWNAETKTLEMLPKFKVGDRIKKKGIDDAYAVEIATIIQSIYTFTNKNWQSVESVDRDYELVTDIKPKFKVGDRIRNKHINSGTDVIIDIEGNRYILLSSCEETYLNFKYQDNYELVSDKFDITTLKPFDKVLVRDDNDENWAINWYGYYNKEDNTFRCIGNCDIGWEQCVPYEGNEHLLGTTNDCDEYYKNW